MMEYIFPIVLLGFGIYLIYRSKKRKKSCCET